MSFWTLGLQILPVFVLIYFYIQHKYSYWSRRGISGPKPLPFLGNLVEALRKGQVATVQEWHRTYGKIYGTYTGFTPVLSIAEPELIKHVMIKDFNLFMNRQKPIQVDPVDAQNLFNLEGDHWKRVRAITSPSFTSGKLRGMNASMIVCCDKFVDYFDRITNNAKDGVIDTKNAVIGFTMDVIASTSFATETNTNDDRSSKNPFVENAEKLNNFTLGQVAFMLLIPRPIRRIVNEYFYKERNTDFFYELIKLVVSQRQETNAKRHDFVQLLIDSKVSEKEIQSDDFSKLTASMENEDDPTELDKTKLSSSSSKITKSLNNDEIISQSLLFFVAGFETTASTISHCLFELATNPDVQERFYEELSQALDGIDVNSEQYCETVLTKIPYLEAVMKETLRKYPPLARLDRRLAVSGYKLGGIVLEKDQLVSVAAYAVHHDPEYYPEPERFNPERFLPENKHLLVKNTYLAFGAGPRNCVGMRFAYQEIKLCLAKIVSRFQFVPTEGTPDKLELGKVALAVSKTFPLKVVRR